MGCGGSRPRPEKRGIEKRFALENFSTLDWHIEMRDTVMEGVGEDICKTLMGK